MWVENPGNGNPPLIADNPSATLSPKTKWMRDWGPGEGILIIADHPFATLPPKTNFNFLPTFPSSDLCRFLNPITSSVLTDTTSLSLGVHFLLRPICLDRHLSSMVLPLRRLCLDRHLKMNCFSFELKKLKIRKNLKALP